MQNATHSSKCGHTKIPLQPRMMHAITERWFKVFQVETGGEEATITV